MSWTVERAPLRQAVLRDAVLAKSRLWTDVQVVQRTGSTNSDLLAASRQGAAAGSILVAEEQTGGRGRLGRSWQSAPGAALTFSVLVRPAAVAPGLRGWLPLLAGVAAVSAVRRQSGLAATLKWPNDILSYDAKLAGILAEQAGDAVVVGFGINVCATADELPSDAATSLALRGAARPDRHELLLAVLREFEFRYLRWAGGRPPGDAVACGLRAEYRRACSTIGKDVRVELPGGSLVAGRATGIDDIGRLVIATPDSIESVSAGDVVHVR